MRPKYGVHLPLHLAKTPQDHNRVWTGIFVCSTFLSLLHCSLVIPHSHAFFLLSLHGLHLLHLRFDLGSSIHGVIFCECWFVLAHGRRRNFEQSNHFTSSCFHYILLIYIFFLGNFDSFKPFGFNLWHGIILNTIHLSVLFPFYRYFTASFLGHILMWSGWSLKIVF